MKLIDDILERFYKEFCFTPHGRVQPEFKTDVCSWELPMKIESFLRESLEKMYKAGLKQGFDVDDTIQKVEELTQKNL